MDPRERKVPREKGNQVQGQDPSSHVPKKSRSETLWTDLHNQHTRVGSQYPEDLASTYMMVYQFKPERQVTESRFASEPSISAQLQSRQAGAAQREILGY